MYKSSSGPTLQHTMPTNSLPRTRLLKKASLIALTNSSTVGSGLSTGVERREKTVLMFKGAFGD